MKRYIDQMTYGDMKAPAVAISGISTSKTADKTLHSFPAMQLIYAQKDAGDKNFFKYKAKIPPDIKYEYGKTLVLGNMNAEIPEEIEEDEKVIKIDDIGYDPDSKTLIIEG